MACTQSRTRRYWNPTEETVGNSWTVLKVILGRKYRSKSFKTWQCCPPHLSVASFSQPAAALTTLLWPFTRDTGAPPGGCRIPWAFVLYSDWRPQCQIPCSVQNYYYPFKSLTTIPILIRVSAGSDMAPPLAVTQFPATPLVSSSPNNIQDECLNTTGIYGVREKGCVAGNTIPNPDH